MSEPEMPLHKIELVYYKYEPIDGAIIKEIKPITVIKGEKAGGSTDIAEPRDVKIDLKKKEEIKTTEEAKASESTISEIKAVAKAPKDLEEAAAKGDTEENNAYDDYRLRVREKIKSVLEKNEKNFARDGDVYVKLVIQRNGAIKDISLYKRLRKHSRVLEGKIIHYIKSALPLMPFSGEMKKNQVIIMLPIRVTHEP